MGEDEASVSEEEIPVDDSEAPEAEGVAEIEMKAPELAPEQAAALDGQTLAGLEDQERAELERTSVDLRGGAEAGAGGPVALSTNFTLAEFHCCHGHCAQGFVPSAAVPALRKLVTQVLQPMRDRFGRCTVNSGFRTKLHNGHVGGETNSFHRYKLHPSGPASDVKFATGNVNQWAAEARRLLGNNRGGIGRYPQQNFIHVDLGPARRWNG
jgi:Peptidase M15